MKKHRKDSPSYLEKPFRHREHPPNSAHTQARHRNSGNNGSPQRGFDYYDNYGYELNDDSAWETSHPTKWNFRNAAVNESPHIFEIHRTGQNFDQSEVFDSESDDDPMQKHRKCRDVLCLFIFMAAVIVMVASIVYTYLNGDLQRITNFYTTKGCDTCGKFNKPLRGIPSSGKDLREFPFGLVTFSKTSSNNFIIDPSSLTNVIFTSNFTTSDCVKECPPTTRTVLHRCIPDNSTVNVFSALQIIPESSTSNSNDIFDKARVFFNELAMDIENSWKDIIIICLIGLGIAITMTIFLRLFAGIIIWIIIFCISVISLAGTIALWILWGGILNINSQIQSSNNNSSNENVNSTTWTEGQTNSLLAGAITCTVITVLLLLVFLILRKRITLVIQLFNEAGKAVHSMPVLLLQPIITFVAIALAISAWLIVALLIESSGVPEIKSVQNNQNSIIEENCYLQKNWIIIFSRWWNLFMVFWMVQFIISSQHLIIAGAISTWFFTRNKKRVHFPILTSFKRLIRYHLGSIAFGSLIIAIVKIIRYILTILQKRLENSNNSICKGIICCCKCCIWCLEKFLIFLNRNAYIEIAIHGYGFCKAARRAFTLIVNNALRIAAINSIGDFILFLSKLGIVAITILIGYQLIKGKENIHHIWAPLLLAGICCYFIAHCFISVYEMAIDTIFLCFCEDCEMNNGMDKPYFMSKDLMDFVKFGMK